MIFSFKDAYRQAVEFLSDGQNTVMYDDQGNPNIMVCIPKYTLDMIKFGKEDTHPAFVCEGKEVNEFWISKYQNTIGNGGVPCSMPDADPAIVTPQVIHDSCLKKGRGWHQMTNLEWMAVAFMSWKTGKSKPGASHNNPELIASIHRDEKGFPMNEIGEPSLSHDGTIHGIIGMNGGYWEHVDGIYTMNTHGVVRNIYWNAAEDGSPINAFDNPHYVCVDNINLDSGRKSESTPLYVDIDCDDGLSYVQNSVYIFNQFTNSEICGSNFDGLYPKTKTRDFNWLHELGLVKMDGMTEESGVYGIAATREGLESRFLARGGDIILREGYCGLFGYYFYHQLNEGNDVTSFRSVYISK